MEPKGTGTYKFNAKSPLLYINILFDTIDISTSTSFNILEQVVGFVCFVTI